MIYQEDLELSPSDSDANEYSSESDNEFVNSHKPIITNN